MDDAVNIAAQATAEVLSKYYKIDFEFLDLKIPEKSKTNMLEKNNKKGIVKKRKIY